MSRPPPPSHHNQRAELDQGSSLRRNITASPETAREIPLSRDSASKAESGRVSGSPGHPKKSNVSSACVSCRKLKIKCNGCMPCATCLARHTEDSCAYDIDNRRKGVLKGMLRDSQQENNHLQRILQYLRSADDESAAVFMTHIRNGQTTDELIRHMENVSAVNHQDDSGPSGASTRTSEGNTKLSRRSSAREWTSLVGDVQLKKQLIKLYFNWQHHYAPIFSGTASLTDATVEDAQFSSPALLNAVMAAGCLYHDSVSEADARGTNDMTVALAEEADRLIQEDLRQGRSSLASIEALIIMVTQDLGAGKDADAWYHLGLAVIMATNLVLEANAIHEDNFADSDASRATYWGLYVTDRLVSFMLGRVPQMRPPCHPRKPSDRYWQEENALLQPAPVLNRPGNLAQVVASQYELFEIINDIQLSMHLPGQKLDSDDIDALHKRLLQWRERQPAGMDPIPYAAPIIFHLRLLYYAAILRLLHTPFGSHKEEPSPIRQVAACKEAALAICHILSTYDQCYGLSYAPVHYLSHISQATKAMIADVGYPEFLPFFLHYAQCIRSMVRRYKQAAQLALRDILSALRAHKIKLPKNARTQLAGIVPLEPFDDLFGGEHIPDPTPATQISDFEQRMHPGTLGTYHMPDQTAFPLGDTLMGEFIPHMDHSDFLGNDFENPYDRNWG